MTVRSPRLYIVDPAAAGSEYDALGEAIGSPEEVRRAATRLQQLAHEGAFHRTSGASAVVYRLTAGAHQQTGVVVEVPVEDYRAGRVRRHEATRDDRERELSEFQAAAGIELVPVTLTHAPRRKLKARLADATEADPDQRLVSADGLTQEVWVVRDEAAAERILAELSELGSLYIADGHHRLAVADQHAGGRVVAEGSCPADFVLGAVFPSDEMRVFGYHRGVLAPGKSAAPDLLDVLSRQPGVGELTADASARPVPGVVSVYLDERWHRLALQGPSGPVDPRSTLDVVVLDEGVLAGFLAAYEGASSVLPLPGTFDAAAVEQWCADERGIGFLLHPPSVEELMAVSDAGLLMPAKSTWFDPKARAGPFLRDLRCE